MRVLRISLTDGEVGPYGEFTDREDCDPRQFWDQWNGTLAMDYWHQTDLDRAGNPYTVKWYSHTFRNSSGVWVARTGAMEADGHHPADTQPRPETPTNAPPIPATQRGRLNAGERLHGPHGTWTVTESWVASKHGCQGTDRDYHVHFVSGDNHVFYLLTHEDGHQEEWSAPALGEAGFHRILPDQQKTLT